jgi:hypothetical protein
MDNLKDWQLNTHSFHLLSMEDASEALSYLTELDAELQGAIRVCRGRVSALKDFKITRLSAELLCAQMAKR